MILVFVPILIGVKIDLQGPLEPLKTSLGSTAVSPSSSAYSVIEVMSDDVTASLITTACGGNCAVNMPTLDTLRSEGVTFTQYHPSGACAQNRASILGGTHSFQNGIYTGSAVSYDAANLELPTMLRANREPIETVLFGKLGLASSPADESYWRAGIGYFWGYTGALIPGPGAWYGYSMTQGTYPNDTATVTGGPTDYLGDDTFDLAITWINALDEGDKYVMYLWPPFVHSGQYHDPPGSVPPASCVGVDDPFDCCTGPGAGATCVDTDNDCDAGDDDCITAGIRYMDTKLGEVITAALAHGPVLVIYHGDDNNAAQNGEVIEELVIAYGDIDAGLLGTTSTALVQPVDIAPTIADYADFDPATLAMLVSSEELHGYSLRSILTDGATCTAQGEAAGSCWDGSTARCVYNSEDDSVTVDRWMRCNSSPSAGYLYRIESDGTNPRIYELAVSTSVECNNAACLAAEAELEVLLPAYDGLPSVLAGEGLFEGIYDTSIYK